jgi:hypothetical protein
MSWFWAHSAGPSICDNLLLARLVDPELRREAERLSPAVFEATPKELVDRGILPVFIRNNRDFSAAILTQINRR